MTTNCPQLHNDNGFTKANVKRVFDAYIYHGKCTDGATAMAIATQHIPDGHVYTSLGATHGEPIDISWLDGLDVLFLDFSYDVGVMKDICKIANIVTVLDHHVSSYVLAYLGGNLNYYYDANQSGAGIAWNYFYPQYEKPLLIKLVEDRDIWTKKYAESDALAAAIRTRDYTVADLTVLIKEIIEEIQIGIGDDNGETVELIKLGESLLEERQAMVKSIASYAFRDVLDDG